MLNDHYLFTLIELIAFTRC